MTEHPVRCSSRLIPLLKGWRHAHSGDTWACQIKLPISLWKADKVRGSSVTWSNVWFWKVCTVKLGWVCYEASHEQSVMGKLNTYHACNKWWNPWNKCPYLTGVITGKIGQMITNTFHRILSVHHSLYMLIVLFIKVWTTKGLNSACTFRSCPPLSFQ